MEFRRVYEAVLRLERARWEQCDLLAEMPSTDIRDIAEVLEVSPERLRKMRMIGRRFPPEDREGGDHRPGDRGR
jgi:hypothetical protein